MPVHFNNWGSMRKIMVFIILMAFGANFFVSPVYAQGVSLPLPGVRVPVSNAYVPCSLKGLKFYPDQPLRFDFVVDPGEVAIDAKAVQGASRVANEVEIKRQIKYFLASLTTPKQDLWVNLSPFEKDRIIPESFGMTELGRDLLAQDYLLKQVTATALGPDDKVGKEFWKRVYAAAQEKFGTTNIPVDSFHKVWITPGSADVYVKNSAVYIVKASLKLMLASDYEAAPTQNLSTDIMREVVLPELEKEVNRGANFAVVRQAYQALILAAWFKKRVMAASPLHAYIDQKRIAGITIDDPKESAKIWGQYVQSVKRGVYDFVREEKDPYSGDVLPRKYFSGGADYSQLEVHEVGGGLQIAERDVLVRADLEQAVDTPSGVGAGQAFLDARKDVMAARGLRTISIAPQDRELARKAYEMLKEQEAWLERLISSRDGSVQQQRLFAAWKQLMFTRMVIENGEEVSTPSFAERFIGLFPVMRRLASGSAPTGGDMSLFAVGLGGLFKSIQFFNDGVSLSSWWQEALDQVDFIKEWQQAVLPDSQGLSARDYDQAWDVPNTFAALAGFVAMHLQYPDAGLLGQIHEIASTSRKRVQLSLSFLKYLMDPSTENVDLYAEGAVDPRFVFMAPWPSVKTIRKEDRAMFNIYAGENFTHHFGVYDRRRQQYVDMKVREVSPGERNGFWPLIQKANDALPASSVQWDAIRQWFVAGRSDQRMLLAQDAQGQVKAAMLLGVSAQDPLRVEVSVDWNGEYDFLEMQFLAWALAHYRQDKNFFYVVTPQGENPQAASLVTMMHRMDVDSLRLEQHLLDALYRDAWTSSSAQDMLCRIRGHKSLRVTDENRALAKGMLAQIREVDGLLKEALAADGPGEERLKAFQALEKAISGEATSAEWVRKPLRMRLWEAFPIVHELSERRMAGVTGMDIPEDRLFELGLGELLTRIQFTRDRFSPQAWVADALRADVMASWARASLSVDSPAAAISMLKKHEAPFDVINTVSPALMWLQKARRKGYDGDSLALLHEAMSAARERLHIVLSFLEHLADERTAYADIYESRHGVFMMPAPSLETLKASSPADQARGIYGQEKFAKTIVVRDQVTREYARLRIVDVRDKKDPADRRNIFSQIQRAYKDTDWKWRFVKAWFDAPEPNDRLLVALDANDTVVAAEMVSWSVDGALVLDVWMKFNQDFDLIDSQFLAWTLANLKKDGPRGSFYSMREYYDNEDADIKDKLFPMRADLLRFEHRLLMSLHEDALTRPSAQEILKDIGADSRDLGGIDFNTDRVAVHEAGDGAAPLVSQQGDFFAHAVQGFVPVIVGVRPVADVRALFN